MSIIGIAIRNNETEPQHAAISGTTAPTTRELITNALAAYVKWIPAEVVVAYGAYVAANWQHQLETIAKANPAAPVADLPSPVADASMWWVGLVASACLMIVTSLIAWNVKSVVRKTLFAALGFLLWSISLEHSWTSEWDVFKDMSWGAIGLILVLGGGAVAAAGEKILSLGNLSGWKQIF